MFGSAILETAIGLIFVYLLMGLILSAVTELISSWLHWRAKTLQEALHNLLDASGGGAGDDWVEKLFKHPLVQGLSRPRGAEEPALAAEESATAHPERTPAYIPARIFSTALLDLVRGPGDPATDLLQKVRATLETVPDMGTSASVRQQMQTLIDRFPATGRLARELSQLLAAPPEAGLREAVQQVLANRATDPALQRLTEAWSQLPVDLSGSQLEAKASALLGTVEKIGNGKRDLQQLIDFLPAGASAAECKAAILALVESQDLRALVETVEEKLSGTALGHSLSALLRRAQGRLTGLEQAVETWFNDSMNQVSGWYRRKTQQVHIVLAVILTVGLNVDTMVLIQALSTDTDLRQALVVQAEATVENPPAQLAAPAPQTTEATTIADTQARAQEVDELLDQLDQLDLPVGWLPAGSDDPVAAKQQRIFPPLPASSSGFEGWAKRWLAILWFHFFGWVMTAAAASLGAPFWFDLLKKVISIRSNGQPPAETEKKAA